MLLPMVGSQTALSGGLPSLFGKTRQALLALLYARADEEHLQESLIQLAGLGRGTVQRELEFLARAGVVRRTVRGRQVYFQANAESPIYAELRGLVVKTAGVADALRTALAPLSGRIRTAFIYGSIAKGAERRGSDVDVMVIGDVSFAETSEALAPAQKAIGREVNPSVYAPADFRAKLAAKHHFLRSVMKREKIFLIGDDRELARLAKK
ncbi:MAG: nucleotidyltransferase domain-containing protein [Betaproteobacteria bacterium]|nr:nucleotidyltransferase domain-containing protein [Betaproteobacteria bacterium]